MNVYLDNAATTRIDPRVLAKMLPYFDELYGNPGSIHKAGLSARDAIKKARKQVAKLLNASPEQIIFTSGGTEANNLAIQGVSDYLIKNGKRHIIISAVEHDSVLNTVEKMCIKDGFHSTILGVESSGMVSVSSLCDAITDNTGIVSVMYENNEIGAINEVNKIAAICRERGILFHTDCVQAAGTELIDVKEIDCDLATISSHKIHGPKGTGALYVRNPDLLSPIVFGGTAQEFGLRSGTENVPCIVGFGEACKLAAEELKTNQEYLLKLKKAFYDRLFQNKEFGFFNINGDPDNSGSKIININFRGVDGETLLLMLDARGISISSGSACRSHESIPSRTLLALGADSEDAMNSVRISFSKYNDLDQVRYAADTIIDCVNNLRREVSL